VMRAAAEERDTVMRAAAVIQSDWKEGSRNRRAGWQQKGSLSLSVRMWHQFIVTSHGMDGGGEAGRLLGSESNESSWSGADSDRWTAYTALLNYSYSRTSYLLQLHYWIPRRAAQVSSTVGARSGRPGAEAG